jgi:hypothetical protein
MSDQRNRLTVDQQEELGAGHQVGSSSKLGMNVSPLQRMNLGVIHASIQREGERLLEQRNERRVAVILENVAMLG